MGAEWGVIMRRADRVAQKMRQRGFRVVKRSNVFQDWYAVTSPSGQKDNYNPVRLYKVFGRST